MKENLLSFSGIELKRSGRIILNVANLTITKNQFVGIIGTNGAGKSTFLNICCGLIKPTSGEIEFDGVNLFSLNSWAKTNLRKRIGYIPQSTEYNTQLPFTLREVVAMGRTSVRPLFCRLNKKDYEYADYWINKLGLSNRSGQTFRTLSGGEQQKTLIARAMTQQACVLMLDEPSSNLDFYWKYKLVDTLDDLYSQTKITILMVSHETNLLPKSCSRIILLDKGKVAADDSPEELFKSKAIESAYKCKVETVNIGERKYVINTGE